MSAMIKALRQIEGLDITQLVEALRYVRKKNGYSECVGAIQAKSIDGQTFLTLTEVQISLWRLPQAQSRRLWSFIQQVRQDPSQFLLPNGRKVSKPALGSNTNTTGGPPAIVSHKRPTVGAKPDLTRITKPKKENNGNEVNSSTLTKKESKDLKSRLEQMFQVEQSESLNVRDQRRLMLPPKPSHLIVDTPEDEVYEECPDDGYLSPIATDRSFVDEAKSVLQNNNTPTALQIQSGSNRSNNDNFVPNSNATFLGKFRKNYEHLEKRLEVIENAYEGEQRKPKRLSVRDRPLPPLPPDLIETRNATHAEDMSHSEPNEEELPEYIPMPDCEEYIELIEDDNPHISSPQQNQSFSRQQLPLPKFADLEVNSRRSPIMSSILKRRELPKPPIDLPKPPTILPKPPINLLQLDLERQEPEEHKTPSPVNVETSLKARTQLRPLPPLPVEPEQSSQESEDELMETEEKAFPYYSKVQLPSEPCYRETDRKGARILLEGLEDGAFVIRPSRQEEYLCTFSIKHSVKMFNLGVVKQKNGTIIFQSLTPDFGQPEFYEISDMVSYYSNQPLLLSGEEICLKNVLPRNRH